MEAAKAKVDHEGSLKSQRERPDETKARAKQGTTLDHPTLHLLGSLSSLSGLRALSGKKLGLDGRQNSSLGDDDVTEKLVQLLENDERKEADGQ